MLFSGFFPMTLQSYTQFHTMTFSCNLAVFLAPPSVPFHHTRHVRFLENSLKLPGYLKKTEN